MSLNRRTNSFGALRLVGWAGLIAILVVPSHDRSAVAADVAAARRQQIESMSERERSRVAMNFKEFKKLSEAEREHYRQLYQNLQADPPLQDVMRRYADWFKDLGYDQKQQLLTEKDPALRRELVVKIREEQAKARPLRFPRGGPGDSRTREIMRSGPNPADFSAVMNHLEFKLSSGDRKPSPSQLARLKELSGFKHHLLLLDLLMAPPEPGQTAPQKPLFKDAFPELINLISDKEQREFLTKNPMHLFMWIVSGIRKELTTELDHPEQGQPAFERYLAELEKADDREQILLLETGLQKARLVDLYSEKVWQLFWRGGRSWSPWPRPPSNRPGEGPPGPDSFRGRPPGEFRDRGPGGSGDRRHGPRGDGEQPRREEKN
jgi:hypothetical protein